MEPWAFCLQSVDWFKRKTMGSQCFALKYGDFRVQFWRYQVKDPRDWT